MPSLWRREAKGAEILALLAHDSPTSEKDHAEPVDGTCDRSCGRSCELGNLPQGAREALRQSARVIHLAKYVLQVDAAVGLCAILPVEHDLRVTSPGAIRFLQTCAVAVQIASPQLHFTAASKWSEFVCTV